MAKPALLCGNQPLKGHVFVSYSLHKNESGADLLAAERMVTAHLPVPDVCQCGSGAAVKRKTFSLKYVAAQSAWLGVSDPPESDCTEISQRSPGAAFKPLRHNEILRE